MHRTLRNILLILAISPLTTAVFAQAAQRTQTMPSQLMLQASPGAKQGTYQDASGKLYNVAPTETGGTQCDPQGCMVQVCNGGACDYYYCRTGGGCKRVEIPSAMTREKEPRLQQVG
jgi:hypothetical protein